MRRAREGRAAEPPVGVVTEKTRDRSGWDHRPRWSDHRRTVRPRPAIPRRPRPIPRRHWHRRTKRRTRPARRLCCLPAAKPGEAVPGGPAGCGDGIAFGSTLGPRWAVAAYGRCPASAPWPETADRQRSRPQGGGRAVPIRHREGSRASGPKVKFPFRIEAPAFSHGSPGLLHERRRRRHAGRSGIPAAVAGAPDRAEWPFLTSSACSISKVVISTSGRRMRQLAVHRRLMRY